jgi:SAM-dependent methyltransferase
VTERWRVWRTHRGTGGIARLRALGRLVLVPLDALSEQLAETAGPILSLGAGDGIVERCLLRANPRLAFECSDVDPVRVAQANAASADSGLRFVVADATAFRAERPYAAAMAVDLLHHIPAPLQPQVLATLAGAVRPGGLIVIKDVGRTPRWKHRWNQVHDRLVSGDRVHCVEPEEVAAGLCAAGAEVTTVRRITGSPYASYLVAARAGGVAAR